MQALERIRRAGTKILEENKDKEGIENLDIGFRVFKVDSSNMKDVYYNPDEIRQDNLFDMVSNIKEDRTDLDLLFQVLLDSGVELTLPIEEKQIAGKKVYFVDGNVLAACFEDNLTEEFVTELAKCEDLLKVVFRDSSFGSDDSRINVEQIFKQYSPDTQIRVI
jgi:adenine-specific DNA-methyltransferase